MAKIEEEILDAPLRPVRKTGTWAIVCAVGIAGLFVNTLIRLRYVDIFDETIVVSELQSIPNWVFWLTRLSALAVFLGVVLTVLRKEPPSSFRSWVIGIGVFLLLLMGLGMAFAVYTNS